MDTKDKFKLEVIAGMEAMNNEVSKLYYLEDIYISDWTRKGELIITTAIASTQEGWLRTFVESLLPFEPSGIVINVGGYISSIPKDIVDYCNEKTVPLLIFPWEIFLQDLMQEMTNRIFTAEQLANNMSNAALNAIFTPESKAEYQPCFERNGYGSFTAFTVAIIGLTDFEDKAKCEFVIRMSQSFAHKMIGVILEEVIILVFCQVKVDRIKTIIEEVATGFAKRYKDEKLWAGVGNTVKTYFELHESFNKAKVSRKYATKTHKNVVTFHDMGIEGILSTCDIQLMREYVDKKLGVLIEYDNKCHSDFMNTLEVFIKCSGNASEVAKEMFLHRNTVNYRIKKIKEILGNPLDSMKDMVEYQMAFYINNLLD